MPLVIIGTENSSIKLCSGMTTQGLSKFDELVQMRNFWAHIILCRPCRKQFPPFLPIKTHVGSISFTNMMNSRRWSAAHCNGWTQSGVN
ncbi:hypothetical protein PR048_017393 [Dryococelus australis]|uniref:Uncharacterized protein n=1 Tax=Dryococelus australis TaxID=614101 RepID=A0ABQ9H9D9_9NEOP|nr:hypothetical protein PR048_017393 [Dryococelus australis]